MNLHEVPQLANCLNNAQPLPAHRPAPLHRTWQMIGRWPVPISTADADFGTRLAALFYCTRIFLKTMYR